MGRAALLDLPPSAVWQRTFLLEGCDWPDRRLPPDPIGPTSALDPVGQTPPDQTAGAPARLSADSRLSTGGRPPQTKTGARAPKRCPQ